MDFSSLPPAVTTVWAKSGDAISHGLSAHLLDVAAVAEIIVGREPVQTSEWIAAAFGLPIDVAPRWLGAMCGLHDFGKAIPGFQAKWPEGRHDDESAGLRFIPSVAPKADRHDLASAVLLRPELARLFPASTWIQAVTLALGAHHGYFPRPQELGDGKPRFEGAEWAQARVHSLAQMAG